MMVRLAAPDDKTDEFYVHCGDCAHEWVAFYTPIKLYLVARFKNICCPKCASQKVFVGKAPRERKP